MTWMEVSISVNCDEAPAVEDCLDDLGAAAVTLQDTADHPVFEPDPASMPLWPVVQVCGLFAETADRRRITAKLQSMAAAGHPDRIRWRKIRDRDWTLAWMDRFEPMRFGRRLWVVPGGMSIPADPQNIEIRLDPGLAFGTGNHPTTALCLEWLDGHDMAGQKVVDYGCGSGVLGIAAALLGAARVICVDNDPQALEATAENAVRNSVADRICCERPDTFTAIHADVVLANILAGPLVALMPVLTGCSRPGADIVLSGLLEEQLAEVQLAYRPECIVLGSAIRDEWGRLDLRRL